MKRTFFNILICTVLMAGDARLAPAQSSGGFTISLATIDGGGGASSGGGYSISGTLGQPDAGTMSEGSFTLAGGFWSGVVSGPEPLPRLAIRLAGGNSVVLSWPSPSTGYQLQRTTATGWTDVTQAPTVSGGVKDVTLPIDAPYRFFRLQKP